HPGREGTADRVTTREARRAGYARPGTAAVARGLGNHLFGARVAVAEVAVALERALRPVVARDPLLVLAELRAGRDGGHRRAPVPAVRRAADDDRRAASS